MMSPPLLQPLTVSPIRVSSGMTEEIRLSRVLKIRISPMLLSPTTYPLPAHRPWSAGSMSCPSTLVLCVPLSTALSPLTPFAPSGLRLIRSHPAPSGAQFTDGGAGSGPFLETIGDGIMCASAEGFASLAAAALRAAISASAALAAAVALADPTAKDAVDGETNGPVSRLQPLAQPGAAEPTKVGEKLPRLEEGTLEPRGFAI